MLPAINSLTETKMTPASQGGRRPTRIDRRAIVHGAAEAENCPAEVRVADRGPFLADEALQAKLVDRLATATRSSPEPTGAPDPVPADKADDLSHALALNSEARRLR
jgi:hypothetical protein